MQFATLALFAVAAATSTLAAATGVATGGSPIPASQCNTGPVQCCNETGTTKDASIAKALALVGVDVSDVNVLIGLTCDPISVIGIGGNSCSAQPVCCTNNSFKGVVAIGCTPVDLNL